MRGTPATNAFWGLLLAGFLSTLTIFVLGMSVHLLSSGLVSLDRLVAVGVVIGVYLSHYVEAKYGER